MIYRRLPALAFTLALILSAVDVDASDWRTRLHGQSVSSGGELFVGQDFDETVGVYFGVERRFSERWGVELGLGWNEFETGESFSLGFFGFSIFTDIEGRVRSMPVTAALNYHLSAEASDVDFYVAPVVGWAFLEAEIESRVDVDTPFGVGTGFGAVIPVIPGDSNLANGSGSADLEADDAFLYGLRLGIDWPLRGSDWHFSGAIDYSVLELEAAGATITDLDPLRLGFGFALNF